MTTAGNFPHTVLRADREVAIAGVPWPAYKLIALVLGALAMLVVGAVTMAAAPAVLTAAGVTAIAWVGLGALSSARR